MPNAINFHSQRPAKPQKGDYWYSGPYLYIKGETGITVFDTQLLRS